jgi:4-hydroxybenzoate polyprenyltransferase
VNFATALRLGRVSNLPTVWSNVFAGSALAGAATDVSVFYVILAASAFYIGGMYLNDAFDRDIDARERPERPIPSGAVSAKSVFAVGFGLLAVGIAGLAAVGSRATGAAAPAALWGGVLAAFVVAYDFHHKDSPTAPVVMGACRALVYLCAAAALTTGAPPAALIVSAFALCCYVVGLTHVAAFENRGSIVNRLPLLLLAVPPATAYFGGRPDATGWAAILAFCLWAAYALGFAHRKFEADIPGAVVRLIAGIALVDAIFAAMAGRPDLAVAAAAMLPLTRLFQRFVPGT